METDMELQTTKTTVKIDAHTPHKVESIEELKIEGEEGVLCLVCEEQLSGPGFKCPKCPFLCHKSCGLLEYKIEHPLHPEHHLELEVPLRYAYCDACSKCCGSCFSYNCFKCDFRLDTKCVSRWRVKKDTCEPHAFVPLVEQIQFTCKFCGKEGKGNGCLCSLCRLTVHSKCAPFLRTINVSNHPHPLKLRYSAHEVEKQEEEEKEDDEQEVEIPKVEKKEEQEIEEQKEQGDMECKLCFGKLNANYAFYYCRECKFAAHLRCASDREVMEQGNEIFGSVRLESQGYFACLIKDKNRAVIKSSLARTINHFSHQQHELILNLEENTDNKVCEGCMQPISVPFYSCVRCDFFLHSLCATVQTKASFFGASLIFDLLTLDEIFRCYTCKRWRHGFAYKFPRDDDGDDYVDIQCLMVLENIFHDLHQHPLFVGRLDADCNSCSNSCETGILSCSACNFSLCRKCAIFPSKVPLKFDDHPLELTPAIKDNFEEYYCLICEKERNSKKWFYYCKKCDFTAHRKCVVKKYSYIKFGKNYKDEYHPHPFIIVQKTESSPSCDACGKDFEGMALHCRECNINIHPYFDNLYCQDHLKKFNNLLNED